VSVSKSPALEQGQNVREGAERALPGVWRISVPFNCGILNNSLAAAGNYLLCDGSAWQLG
jgi:hypothetical protein